MKSIKRINQKISNKLGLGQETIDVQFNAHHQRFKEREELLNKVVGTMRKIQSTHRDLTLSAVHLTLTLKKIVSSGDDDNTDTIANLSAHTTASMQCEAAWNSMFEKTVANAILPLCMYEGWFWLLNERVSVRNTRRVDMDRYVGNLANKSKKDKATFDRANAKCEGAKLAYESLNEELKVDLPNCSNELQTAFDYCFAALLTYMNEYVRIVHAIFTALQNDHAHAKRNGLIGHMPVVTAAAQSVAAQKATPKSHTLDEYDAESVIPANRMSAEIVAKPARSSTREAAIDGVQPKKKASSAPKRAFPVAATSAKPAVSAKAAATRATPSVPQSRPEPKVPASAPPAAKPAMPASRPPGAGAAAPRARGGGGAPRARARGAAMPRGAARSRGMLPVPAGRRERPTPAPKKEKEILMVAKWPFEATEDGELTVAKGEVVKILSKEGGDWWLAESVSSGKKGDVPSNYFEEK